MKTFYYKVKAFDCNSNNETKNKIILSDLGFSGLNLLALHV